MTGEHSDNAHARLDPVSTGDRITEAAIELIGEHGLGGVTMSAVAQTAGVSRQTLYNHYADVEGIVAAAIRRHNQEAIALLEASLRVCGTPTCKLEQLVRHFVTLGIHGHGSTQIEHGLSAETRADLGIWEEAVNDRIREVLEDGMRTGDFRADLVPSIDGPLIRNLLDGVQNVAAQSPNDSARVAETGMRTVLAAVESRSSGSAST